MRNARSYYSSNGFIVGVDIHRFYRFFLINYDYSRKSLSTLNMPSTLLGVFHVYHIESSQHFYEVSTIFLILHIKEQTQRN